MGKRSGISCRIFSPLLSKLPDPRCQGKIDFPKQLLVWAAITVPLLALGSRRQYRYESKTDAFVKNLNLLSGTEVEVAPHDDTISYYLERVPPEAFAVLPVSIVRHLIRKKALDRWRLFGSFLIAIDGTGQLTFHERHCPHCLTRTKDGRTIYYHHVLEAKLICESGMVFSVATQFIENADSKSTKQDCERNAFKRLSKDLKERFPQLPIILLGDGLYACGPVFDICKENNWGFIFSFKQGCIPSLYDELRRLSPLVENNRLFHRPDNKTHQHFNWLNHLEYQDHFLSILDCIEAVHGEDHKYFSWITNILVDHKTVASLANQGGRLRWKIENEGFNIQKNHGYELEHAYSCNEQAAKNWYFLIQVAHALNQLLTMSGLIKHFDKVFGSIKNFFRRLAEAFRFSILPFDPTIPDLLSPIQIRFDTS